MGGGTAVRRDGGGGAVAVGGRQAMGEVGSGGARPGGVMAAAP